jgi:PBSX family phage portal protein
MTIRIRTRGASPAPSSSTASGRTRKLYDISSPRSESNPHVRLLKEYTNQRQLVDPFKKHYAGAGESHTPIEPDYSFYSLMRMPNENSMLRQCIEAMVTNIDGHGHRLMYIGPEGQEESTVALAEKQQLENLLHYPNDDYGFQEMRERMRRDYETLGMWYAEIGRDARNRIVMISHVPAHTMRLTAREAQSVEVVVQLPRDNSGTSKVQKRFRRFVQVVGNRRVYFKEFGDPRRIDPTTGLENPALPIEQSATEILFDSIYTPGSPYGLPRWFNQLPALMGSRQAELTNLDFFKENGIPAMVMLVSGGLLTDESLIALETHFSQARGRGSMNRIAVIEAGGDPSNAPDNGAIPVPKIELKPLQGERQADALFEKYEQANADKVRSSFRLPPIYVGLSSDYTYATAKTSFEIAEGQVFGPERQRFDHIVNAKILASYAPKFWAFRSQPPRISAREDVIKAISVFERVGALTPNVAIGLANEFFDLEIKPVNEAWGDYPFSLITTMVQTNQLDPSVLQGLGELMAPVAGAAASDPTADPTAVKGMRQLLLRATRAEDQLAVLQDEAAGV